MNTVNSANLLPAPCYQSHGVTLYHDSALKILPLLRPVDVILTDPVWPGCEKIFPGIDANDLFGRAAAFFPGLCKRLIVVIGCDIDPRFLVHVPAALPFFRISWMRFVPARYRGTLLAGADCAYVFGARYRCGQKRVIPGECIAAYNHTDDNPTREDHPCSRNAKHIRWLIENYTRPGAVVLDPFGGSGTVAAECVRANRRCISIDIEKKYIDYTVGRIERMVKRTADADWTLDEELENGEIKKPERRRRRS